MKGGPPCMIIDRQREIWSLRTPLCWKIRSAPRPPFRNRGFRRNRDYLAEMDLIRNSKRFKYCSKLPEDAEVGRLLTPLWCRSRAFFGGASREARPTIFGQAFIHLFLLHCLKKSVWERHPVSAVSAQSQGIAGAETGLRGDHYAGHDHSLRPEQVGEM